MKSSSGRKATRKSKSAQQERSAGADRTPAAATRPRPSFPVSMIALAVAFLAAAPERAHAVNECGAEAAGADTVTCTGSSYPSGIAYVGSDGLTLELNNPNMDIQGGGPFGLVRVDGISSNDIAVHARSLGTLTTAQSVGLRAGNSGTGLAAVTMDSGSISMGGGASSALLAIGSGGGDAIATLNGGQIFITGFFSGHGINAQNNSIGNASVVMTGGSVATTIGAGVGLRAVVSNATPGTASVRMTGGSVTAALGTGILSQANGSGQAVIQVSGGTVSAPGNNADGIFARSATGTYAVT
jgi:hypothetical protein